MHKWNSSLIEEILTQKQREKSEDRDNLLKLISRSLYGEAIHYALELIQNAEDERSSSISFIFNKDEAVVVNDGRPFNGQDVWSICSVKTGQKRQKIGFFGIGFKAVFNVTKSPQIISNNFNFKLDKYIYPKAITSIPETATDYYSPDKGAIFILPYSSELASPENLIENFSMIDEKLLLFLDNIKTLQFVDNINSKNWSIKRNPEGKTVSLTTDGGRETKYCKVSLINTFTEQTTKWLVFHQDLPITDSTTIPDGKQGIEKTRITIAFPLDAVTRDKIKKNGVVYCYLPTKKRPDLPLLIQADFLPTIGRENIAEHPWNTWLMSELGGLAAEAINHMKNNEDLRHILYDFIPLAEEIQDEEVKHLFWSLSEKLKEKNIGKTAEKWVKPELCVIPDDDSLRDILSESDLELLFPGGVLYIDPSLSENTGFTRAEQILLELGSKIISINEVIEFLRHEGEVLKKREDWFLNLYDYLRTNFDTSQKSYMDDFPWAWEEPLKGFFKKLETSKFILTDEMTVVPLKDPAVQDRLICYPQSIDLSEVHCLFTEGEILFLNRYFQESSISHRKEDSPEMDEKRKRVKEWFDSIGVKKYFKQTHIIKDVILPKFTTGKYKEYDDSKLYGFLNYIRAYWSTIESEIQNKKLSPEIIEDIKKSVLIKVYYLSGGKLLRGYRKPKEVYFSAQYGKNETMEILFKGIEDIYFLSSYYLNREKKETKKKKRGKKTAITWREFFVLLGVWSSPRVVKEKNWVSIVGKKYEWLEKEYSSKGLHELYGDSISEDIERLIAYCSRNDDTSELRERMTFLWESLEKHWKLYREEEYCSTTYRWSYYGWNQKPYETSSFLEFLRKAVWIPERDGGFSKPSEVFPYTPKNVLLVGDDVKYIGLKANETFLKDLGVMLEPTIDEVVDHLKKYRDSNPDPATNQIEKMRVIYCFLRDMLNSIENMNDKQVKAEQIKNAFDELSLLYLPREDKIWWKPRNVFWRDFSEQFEKLRGYIEYTGNSLYDITLKDFFLFLAGC